MTGYSHLTNEYKFNKFSNKTAERKKSEPFFALNKSQDDQNAQDPNVTHILRTATKKMRRRHMAIQ